MPRASEARTQIRWAAHEWRPVKESNLRHPGFVAQAPGSAGRGKQDARGRDRTGGLRHVEPALWPLSYARVMVDPAGVEPAFPRCERGVFPLDDGPVNGAAAPDRTEMDRASAGRLDHVGHCGGMAERTGVEPVIGR